MKITIGLFFYITFLTNLHAYNFKHFALKGELKQLDATNKSFISAQDRKALTQEINGKLLGEGEDRYQNLFERIVQAIGSNYDTIGERETGPLLLHHQIGGGVVNFSGFTWQKPFANFKLYANRELAPDLFEDRWIVHDSLTIAISASTLLSNMRDLDLIDIDDSAIAAFAGIGFSRTYHYYHFASSWSEGLQADYSKLFMAFTRFNSNSVLGLEPYHILKKEDSFLFNAGGFADIPIWNGIGFRGGILVSKSYASTLTVQALGPGDNPKPEEFLRVSFESGSQTSADAHLALQLDFYNLLKISLLSYDLEYSLEKSEKVYLSFFNKDLPALNGTSSSQFAKLISGDTDSVDYFRSNIVQQDQRFKENLNSKFYFLLLGKITKSATEQIKIVKDGIEKVFFKHYAESKKVIQSLWSKLFGLVIQGIFKLQTGVSNSAEMAKRMEIEYEYEGGQEKAAVTSEEKFSVKLTHTFFAKKTHGFWKSFYRKRAVSHLARHTQFDMSLAKLVGKSKIRGPMNIVTNIMLEQNSLRYFNELDKNQVLNVFKVVCKKSRSCYRSLKSKYLNYKDKLQATGVIDLLKFKSFLGQYFKSVRSTYDYYLLFGNNNVFINGSINAQTDNGLPFQNFFKAGQFKGLGVIDAFMRYGESQVVLPVEID